MRRKLSRPEHGRYLRKKWREQDSSKLERKRKYQLVASHKAAAQVKVLKRALQAEKRATALLQLQAVARNLVLEDADIIKMKATEIILQLRYLRSLKEDDEIPKVKDIKNKKDSLPALLRAMERWHLRHPEGRAAAVAAAAQAQPVEEDDDLEGALDRPEAAADAVPERPASESQVIRTNTFTNNTNGIDEDEQQLCECSGECAISRIGSARTDHDRGLAL